jgi:hypothetical protein
MKPAVKYLMLMLLAFAVAGASAQQLNEDTTTHQPFFKASKFSSRCYVGLEASVVQVLKTRVGSNFGVDLNWVVNHKYVISAIYDGLATQNQIQKIVTPADPYTPLYLAHRYVGLGFSYILFDKKLFSLQPGLSAGWGHMQYKYGDITYNSDFAEIVPAVTATYNCTKYFRVGLGLNYRIGAAAKLNGLNSADISGVGGIIFIKVGTF